MNHSQKSIFVSIFDFFASLKLAVILLVIFGAMLSWATFYESSTSTEEVQQLVYKTLWFDLFLLMLGINVTCSALKRLPWKKRHTGFVLTHTGIIIILIGSLMTRKFGIEGTLALQEGESASFIRLNDAVLSVSIPRLDVHEEFDPWFLDEGVPAGKEIRYPVSDTGLACYVDQYFFNPRTIDRVTNDGQPGHPAIRIAFSQGGQSSGLQPQWLMLDHPGRDTLDLGMAKIVFERVGSQEELLQKLNPPQPVEAPDEPKGEVVLLDPGKNPVKTIPLKELMVTPVTMEYQGAQYIVEFDEFVPRAAVREGKLVNNESGKLNPAVRFEIHGPEGEESHLAFSLFPTLGSSHGNEQSYSGLTGQFNYPIEDDTETSNLVTIFLAADQELFYRASNVAGKFETGEVQVGDSFDTTWNSIQLTVLDFYSNGKVTQEIVDAGKNMEGMHSDPMAHVRVEYNGKTADEYIRFNMPAQLAVGGETCVVELGQRKFPLGFTLLLNDFNAPNYPGTNRPARFESYVTLLDPDNQVEEQQKIYMNNPLDYNNFLVYQSSYQKGTGGRPDISIFSVARDPGLWVKYFGSIVLTLGMIVMFTLKNYSTIKRPAQFTDHEGVVS